MSHDFKNKGTPGIEPGTSRSAVECSTPELYPLLINRRFLLIIKRTAKTVKIVKVTQNSQVVLRLTT